MKGYRSTITCLAASLFASALVGCAANNPPLQVAMNDLTSDSRQSNGDYLHNNSLMSISGMIPVSSPGTIVHFVIPRDATSAIGINPTGDTCLLTSTVTSNRTESERLQAASEIQRLFREYQTSQLEFVNKINSLAAQAFAKLSAGHSVRTENTTFDDTSNSLMSNYADEIGKLRMAVFKAESALVDAVHRNKLIVTRWTRHSDASSKGSVAGFGNYARRSQSDSEGFWILDGLRLQFLVVGKDVNKAIPSLQYVAQGGAAPPLEAISVTTFVAQTQLSCWVSASDELRAAQATATIRVQDALAIAAGSVEAVRMLMSLQAELEGSDITRTNLSNIGMITTMTWSSQPYRWNPSEAQGASGAQDWITFWTQNASLTPRTVELVNRYLNATSGTNLN